MFYQFMKLGTTEENKFIIDKNSPRILMLPSDNFKASGAFISMANLVNILRNKYRLNVFVVIPEDGDGFKILEDFGIPFIIVKSWNWIIPLSLKNSKRLKLITIIKRLFNILAIYKLSKFIHYNKIDLVHLNTTYTYVGALASIKEKTPFVWHLREFLEEDHKNTIWNRDEGYNLINKANKIIVVSDSLKTKYENIFEGDKLIRIYNGVDDKRFYNPNKLIFNDKKLIFIMVGVLEYHKGQIDLAKACSKLYSDGFNDFELWFIGEGDENVVKSIKEIFASVKMNNFKFLGYKKNVEDYYIQADISFNCSNSEAFGRTTVESMLSGNLVIGANSSGTKELLKNNNGLLYELHNTDDLYEKIKFAIENPEISQNIAKNGQKYMYENMTAEINADNVFKVYSNLLNIKY